MTPRTCSIHRDLEVTVGSMEDYRDLSHYHYRDGRPACVKAVFVLRPRRPLGSFGRRSAGVVVYTMPNPRVAMRTVATGGLLAGLDRQTGLTLLNRNVRCIARLIIEPRFRGVGLAGRLVRETMPRMNVPMIEALGVMPLVNPFLERAGMKAFQPKVPVEHVELIEALSAVGIEEDMLVDPHEVHVRLERLESRKAAFVEQYVRLFLRSHGTRRNMPHSIERTRYVLARLTHRPAYYTWFHPDLEVTTP